MTWIVGAAAMAGYAVGISDVRVTFADGRESDCLQKLYPMSRFIAAGFAGSVRIGFAMLDALADLLRDLPGGSAWHPEESGGLFSGFGKPSFSSCAAGRTSLALAFDPIGGAPNRGCRNTRVGTLFRSYSRSRLPSILN